MKRWINALTLLVPFMLGAAVPCVRSDDTAWQVVGGWLIGAAILFNALFMLGIVVYVAVEAIKTLERERSE